MKFFIDAQLPRGLVGVFDNLGHEATHAIDLPSGHSTEDKEILRILEYDVVVVSRDSDFYHSALVKGRPAKLIFVKIMNTKRSLLIELFKRSAPKAIELLRQHDIIQLEADKIISIL